MLCAVITCDDSFLSSAAAHHSVLIHWWTKEKKNNNNKNSTCLAISSGNQGLANVLGTRSLLPDVEGSFTHTHAHTLVSHSIKGHPSARNEAKHVWTLLIYAVHCPLSSRLKPAESYFHFSWNVVAAVTCNTSCKKKKEKKKKMPPAKRVEFIVGTWPPSASRSP